MCQKEEGEAIWEKQYFASIHGIYKSGRFPNQLYILLRCLIEVAAKSLQSCPTLGDLIDGSPPGSPLPGILQARTLEWVAISFSNA